MGYGLEVEMIGAARELDLLTTPYVFSADDAAAMTEAGADIIVCHMGLTTGGSIGAETAKSLDDCVALIDEWAARGTGGPRRRHRAVPRRPDRRAGRRRVRPAAGPTGCTASTGRRAWNASRSSKPSRRRPKRSRR